MLEKGRMQKLGIGLVAAGALSLSTSTGAEARPFGLLLGGGLHHLGGFGGFHHFGGFGGGFSPGGFGGLQRGVIGLRQAGVGYRGYGPAGGSGRWRSGSGRGSYWGAYGAAAAVGAIGAAGAYSNGYSTQDSENSQYPANGYYAYPAYGY